MRLKRSAALAAVAGVVMAGCAVRLGGPSPETFAAVAARAGAEDPAGMAARLQASAPQLVLLAAQQDSAWFAQVATQLGLHLSGPGRTGPTGLAFLTSLEAVGDTSLVLEVPSGGRIHMHDALYEFDEERFIDLMLVRIEENAELRDAVRTLLTYYATDVGNSFAVLLGVEAATPQAADSVALLLRSAFESVGDCPDATPATGTLRLFYGPQARIRCERGQVLQADPPVLSTRVIVGG